MKTLKEELQDIVDKELLEGEVNQFICVHLSFANHITFNKYKDMAKQYAKDFFCGKFAWWGNYQEGSYSFVISEKYRFIKDLIAIL